MNDKKLHVFDILGSSLKDYIEYKDLRNWLGDNEIRRLIYANLDTIRNTYNSLDEDDKKDLIENLPSLCPDGGNLVLSAIKEIQINDLFYKELLVAKEQEKASDLAQTRDYIYGLLWQHDMELYEYLKNNEFDWRKEAENRSCDIEDQITISLSNLSPEDREKFTKILFKFAKEKCPKSYKYLMAGYKKHGMPGYNRYRDIGLGILKNQTPEKKLADYCYGFGKKANEDTIRQMTDNGNIPPVFVLDRILYGIEANLDCDNTLDEDLEKNNNITQ